MKKIVSATFQGEPVKISEFHTHKFIFLNVSLSLSTVLHSPSLKTARSLLQSLRALLRSSGPYTCWLRHPQVYSLPCYISLQIHDFGLHLISLCFIIHFSPDCIFLSSVSDCTFFYHSFAT